MNISKEDREVLRELNNMGSLLGLTITLNDNEYQAKDDLTEEVLYVDYFGVDVADFLIEYLQAYSNSQSHTIH